MYIHWPRVKYLPANHITQTDPSLTRISPWAPGSHNGHCYITAGTIIVVRHSGIVIDFSYVISNSTLYRLYPTVLYLNVKVTAWIGFHLKVH